MRPRPRQGAQMNRVAAIACQVHAITERATSDADDFDSIELCAVAEAFLQGLEAVERRKAHISARNQARHLTQNCAVSDHYHLAAGHDADSFDDFFDGGAA